MVSENSTFSSSLRSGRFLPVWIVVGFLCAFYAFLSSNLIPAALDMHFHIRFAEDFFRGASEIGSWPDWDARPYQWGGSSAFRFYAPLVYIVTAVFQAAGCSAVTGIKLTCLLFALLGVLGTMRWLANLCAMRHTAPAIFLFLTGPILILHLFTLFAFQNLCAMLILPWVLSSWESSRQKTSRVPWVAFWLALMGWTHLPTTLMAGYGLLALSSFELWSDRTPRPMIRLLSACVLAGGLMAPYALPAMLSRSETRFQELQLIVPWIRNDFLDSFVPDPNEVLGLIRNLFLVVALLIGTASLGGVVSALLSPDSTEKKAVINYAPAGWFLLFMSFSPSEFFWKYLPGVAVLQFPLRWVWPAFVFLLPSVLFPCNPNRWKRATRFAQFFSVVLLLCISLLIQIHRKDVPPEKLYEIRQIKFSYPFEYLPSTSSGGLERAPNASFQRLIQSTGPAFNVSSESHKFQTSTWEVFLPATASTLMIATHFDSDWQVFSNQVPLMIRPSGQFGFITFDLGPGSHQIRLLRKPTPFRTIGWVIWLFAVTVSGMVWKKFSNCETSRIK